MTDREAGVIRVTTFHARPGHTTELLDAAAENASAARAEDGCLTAEVCQDSDETVLVISRWASRTHLERFLGWHQGQAHKSVAPFTTEKPQARHYDVVAAAAPVSGRPADAW